MDNRAVFREYAESDIWTTVHLGQYFGFLLVLGGLVARYYSLAARPGRAAGLAPFGLAAAVTTAAHEVQTRYQSLWANSCKKKGRGCYTPTPFSSTSPKNLAFLRALAKRPRVVRLSLLASRNFAVRRPGKIA